MIKIYIYKETHILIKVTESIEIYDLHKVKHLSGNHKP